MQTQPNLAKLLDLLLHALTASCCLAANPTFTIDANRPAGKVSPILYGLMTEEINHAYDGGLYAELIQNRALLDSASTPVHWWVMTNGNSEAAIALDMGNTLNDQRTSSWRGTVTT